MSEKLKCCPFCGKKSDFDEWKQTKIFEKIAFRVLCVNIDCPVQPATDWFNTKEEAIEAWNRRADNDA